MNRQSAKKASRSPGIENLTVVRAVRDGLTGLIPVLIIGAFALVLKEFPVDAYQDFLKSFAGGFFLKLHEIGCDCYQGYLYSPAVPIDE